MRPTFEPAAGNGRVHPSETTHRSIDTDGAIIGTWSVGPMMANVLGLQGVRVVVLEKLAQIAGCPRSIGLDDEAPRVFQSLGLVDELPPHTAPNHRMRVTLNGKCFTSTEPHTDEFGWPRRNAFIEPLADPVRDRGLERSGNVLTLLEHGVDHLSQDACGVTIDATDARGAKTTIRAA